MEELFSALPASQSLSQTAQSNLSTPKGTYITSLCRYGANALASLCSDNSLRVFDRQSLSLLPNGVYRDIHPGKKVFGATGLCEYNDGGQSLLVTSGRDGTVKVWDARKGGGPVQEMKNEDGPTSLTAVACSPQLHMITAGTELASRMAPVLFWDIRSPSKKLMSYTESHNDDITELKFSPFNPRLLLSGSTDELINIYDTSQSDEEEALKQVINHGSVHRAGFLSPNAVYAFSHTEHFGVYPLNAFARGEVQTLEQGEKAVEEPSPIKFGDVRGQLRCNYVAQVVEGLGGFFVGSGMPGQERFDLMPLVSEPTWRFDEKNVIRLPGAHGDEVVRDVYVDVEAQSVITCGEDGYVRTWRFSNEMIATASRVGQAEEDEEMKDTVEAKDEEQSPAKDDKKDKHERKKHRKDKGKEKKEHKPGKEEKRKKKEHRYKPY